MTNIIDIIQEKSQEADEQEEREKVYRQKVLDAFFEYGKLKSIPSQRKKEKIILEEIAKSFEKGKVYTEREVNILIADYFIKKKNKKDYILRFDELNKRNLTTIFQGSYLIQGVWSTIFQVRFREYDKMNTLKENYKKGGK